MNGPPIEDTGERESLVGEIRLRWVTVSLPFRILSSRDFSPLIEPRSSQGNQRLFFFFFLGGIPWQGIKRFVMPLNESKKYCVFETRGPFSPLMRFVSETDVGRTKKNPPKNETPPITPLSLRPRLLSASLFENFSPRVFFEYFSMEGNVANIFNPRVIIEYLHADLLLLATWLRRISSVLQMLEMLAASLYFP